MGTLRFLAVAALVAAGCEQRRPDRTVKCAGVGDQAKALWIAKDPAMAETVALRLVHHCIDDGWSDEAIACARTERDSRTCLGKLTIPQIEKLRSDPEARALQ